MDKKIFAEIEWLPAHQGGKKLIALGKSTLPCRFADNQKLESRSLIIDILEIEFCESRKTKAQIEFLFPEAPSQRLIAGATFQLVEGPRMIGIGKILDTSPI